MTTPESRESMRAVAANPEAFAGYLADMQSHLLGLQTTLAILAQETQVKLRSTYVEGDRKYHAQMRSWPVERQLNALIRALGNAAAATEKAGFQRRNHDKKVAELPALRSAKALEKANKRAPKTLPVNNSTAEVPPPTKTRYAEPGTLYDLGDRRSA
ncbi:hypothetical protein GCM10010441_44720 [Kitasatospora paracochleata]|uniref:Uncharacterized protein YukE n=1 Tax=Kitasatospora paracochleata TaxID=58354 RepID=A0ABT1J9B4_9ACTN|nr:hypothetical protein [Kitasatospora paracochleata]MCP2314049.1 uncharacterized protein YukE [Kitasatospora paracochleata]